MNEIKIKILGNGGCLNNGLPYNSFLINTNFLFESPPDLMLSIKNNQVDISKLKSLFVSHLHGDHTFGFPFLIINLWIDPIKQKENISLNVYGPKGVSENLCRLVEMAFSKNHPCYSWMTSKVKFIEIDNTTNIEYSGFECSFFELEHIKYTYGVKFYNQKENIFTYIADTKWCNSVENVLKEKPRYILADMNGNNPNVHMSKDDFTQKGIEITSDKTIFYGTHLSDEFIDEGNIKCAKTGEDIIIQYD